MNPEIIKLQPDKWQEYKELRLRALQDDPHAFGSSYSREKDFSDREWQERTKNAFEGKSKFMVFARDEQKLVGMMGAKLDDPTTATIVSVYVAPEARGKGISKKLMQSLLDELKRVEDLKIIKLSVNAGQLPAVNLYKSFGFEEKGIKNKKLGDENYYDELLMEKSL